MDLKALLAHCRQLVYLDRQLLINYFDCITFVGSIDEFYQATDEFLYSIQNHHHYTDFYQFLSNNVLFFIENEILPNNNKNPSKPKTKHKKQPRKKHQPPKIKNRRMGGSLPLGYDYNDEIYQSLYENVWQDYNYNDLSNFYIAIDVTYYRNKS